LYIPPPYTHTHTHTHTGTGTGTLEARLSHKPAFYR